MLLAFRNLKKTPELIYVFHANEYSYGGPWWREYNFTDTLNTIKHSEVANISMFKSLAGFKCDDDELQCIFFSMTH